MAKQDRLVLTVRQLADELGISLATAYALVNRDGFPSVRLSERRIVIPCDMLESWLESEASK